MARRLPSVDGLAFGTAGGVNISFRPSPTILAAGLTKLGHDVGSFREPLQRAVKEVMIPSIRANFERGGRPPWPPLKAFTVERKGHATILQDTGALMHTMEQDSIWTITDEYALIKDLPNTVWYGKVHQGGANFGGGRKAKALVNIGTGAKSQRRVVGEGGGGGGNIPARPFVVMQKSDQKKIETIFRHWLDERIRANVGRIS